MNSILLILLVLLTIYVAVYLVRSEGFTDPVQKSQQITAWFAKNTPANSSPGRATSRAANYIAYRSHFGPDANIVDYENYRSLNSVSNVLPV
jgi:hypothetical protein